MKIAWTKTQIPWNTGTRITRARPWLTLSVELFCKKYIISFIDQFWKQLNFENFMLFREEGGREILFSFLLFLNNNRFLII